MGFRFRKSVRLMPGVRLNFSKSGVSTTIGRRGASVNIGKRGMRSTIGVPGTGLSYSATSPRRAQSGGGMGAGGWIALAFSMLLLVLAILS